jgi:hypothetical protein
MWQARFQRLSGATSDGVLTLDVGDLADTLDGSVTLAP